MLHKDALSILGLQRNATREEIAAAYKTLIRKYHPDINPAGEQMTKLLNAARDALADYDAEKAPQFETQANYGEDLAAAINAIIGLQGLEIEICGAWVWVGGDTRTHKDALKAAGYKWASQKKKWNYRPAGWKSASRGRVSMEQIRAKYGSVRPRAPQFSQLEA